MTTTWAPTSTRSNKSVMSWLSIRMQPYEANLPIDSGLLVPWMACSPPESVMAATPIGLLGASHVLVSEAKKPCRTPLATGLHQNRTASDGQKPRLQLFRLRAGSDQTCIRGEALRS